MKIVHICGSVYLDGWGYQDNLLPKYQHELGHDVHVIASGNHFPAYFKEQEKQQIIAKGHEYELEGVHIHRIRTYLSTSNRSFWYKGVYRLLCSIRPDIIFIHGVVDTLLLKSVFYTAFHKDICLFVDNHADYINCSKNWLWFNVYIRGVERMVATICSGLVKRAYGVSPMRCEYLHHIYGFSKAKIDLLPIGADTDTADSIRLTKKELKHKYGLSADDVVIVSGGKMGLHKGTDHLIEAYKSLLADNPSLKLVLFGRFEDSITEELANHVDGIKIIGWCDRMRSLELLKMADIACWPIHHTTLIEDAVACATPLVLRKTGNTEHLIHENGCFVNTGSAEEIANVIRLIMSNYECYKLAADDMREKYSYKSIAMKVIDDCNA